VASSLALPELAPWPGTPGEPDIVIRTGTVPDRLEGAPDDDPFLQVDPRGACLLRIPDVATYHVASAGEVVVAPGAGASPTEVRLFLLGTVLGFLCHLRGVFPLHASAVSIDGRAVAFCGVSGAGKSTTAAHLVQRGHRLLSDDVCAIDTGQGDPRVFPTFPRLKLWQDSLASISVSEEGMERNRPGQSKFHYRRQDDFSAAPTPLAAIFLLARSEGQAPATITRVTNPLAIIRALDEEVYRARTGVLLGRRGALLAAEAAIAASVPVYRVARPWDFAHIDGWLEQVETLVRE